MKKILGVLLIFLSTLFIGCGNSNPTGTTPSEDTLENVIEVGKDALPFSEEEIYAQLFDGNNKIEIDIDMPDSELAKLQADYEKNAKSPIYRKANMTIRITSDASTTAYRITDVGVRMKGNTSRTDFYNSEEGIYNVIHLKIDFQETFDDPEYYGSDTTVWDDEDAMNARKDRTFGTLEKLEMRWNKCYDSTYQKEGYAYQLYRSHGVLAPLTNLCSFDWSGTHMGVFTINEPVDKLFIEKRLPEDACGGDLYKLGWTNTGATFTSTASIGIENEDKNLFFVYDLKTNKKKSEHKDLINFITQLNSENVTKELFAELVDIDNFLNYAAVSYFVGNPDDLRNNYNNSYIYFRKDNGKAIIIPYDTDRCFGITYEWDPTGNGFTTDNPFTDGRDGASDQPAIQQSPLFLYSVGRGGYYVQEYAEALKAVAANPLLEPETFATQFEQSKALYGTDAKPDKEFYNGNERDWGFALEGTTSPNLSFKSYITTKMNTYHIYMAKADEYINYIRPERSSHYLRGDFNGWNSADGWGMKKENDLMTITVDFQKEVALKVYEEASGNWYGIECLPEGTSYTTDNHGNIHLGAGSYQISFNLATKTISITKQ